MKKPTKKKFHSISLEKTVEKVGRDYYLTYRGKSRSKKDVEAISQTLDAILPNLNLVLQVVIDVMKEQKRVK